MAALGFELRSGAGSSRKFISPKTDAILFIHEPHPAKILKMYQIRDAVDFLKQEGYKP